ncbi:MULTISPECIES: Cas9 inhibitor AcrIIA9 family protein [unclassified Dehalobacter]|uniref:Cas9 inhibitor AcrIIA9 family protein n=1 Tax=unclassified Dehalobacter TaxID=2635733 RepID=UPI00104AD24C|nr:MULTISPECIES: Cas9 inhibitor AcrIIA9 family protein [unclassified Dehalobacter]TCX51968.1 hypothetical protein C1I36_06520 [Dehalobacter sp. 14DCB1]TCX53028.1 hypothetical protein C1I38_08200 [Dehalobacter sp. 12DCB1]
MSEINAEQKCRVCGCSNESACMTEEGACYWVESDLCSACADENSKEYTGEEETEDDEEEIMDDEVTEEAEEVADHEPETINNVIEMPERFPEAAVAKIAQELKDFKGDNKATAVSKFVASTLTHFCEENDRFAEVVYKTSRTLSDCCAEIMAGVGTHVSDIDVYRGAVRSYFPNADISFKMNILVNGDVPDDEYLKRKPEKKAQPAKKAKEPVEKKDKPSAPPAPKKETPAPKKPEPKAEKKPELIQLSLF